MSNKKKVKNRASIPTFVFLDENNSRIKFQKLKNAQVYPKYNLKIVPFPADMECISAFDFQVIFHIKKYIISRRYPVREILYQTPRPIFIFITFDKEFIQDSEEGFKIWVKVAKTAKQKKRREEQVRRIKLYENAMTFQLDNDYVVNVAVLHLKGGADDTQQITISKSIKLLEEFLQ